MKDIFAGNQVIHEMSDRYGWKEGSAEKTVLHGALGALTGKMSGGNVLSGAVSESVNEFALGYIEKTKGEEWMKKHPRYRTGSKHSAGSRGRRDNRRRNYRSLHGTDGDKVELL